MKKMLQSAGRLLASNKIKLSEMLWNHCERSEKRKVKLSGRLYFTIIAEKSGTLVSLNGRKIFVFIIRFDFFRHHIQINAFSVDSTG